MSLEIRPYAESDAPATLSALLAHLHDAALRAGASGLYTNASITARPFFEQHGFGVVAEQHPITHGVELTNYRMMLLLRN